MASVASSMCRDTRILTPRDVASLRMPRHTLRSTRCTRKATVTATPQAQAPCTGAKAVGQVRAATPASAAALHAHAAQPSVPRLRLRATPAATADRAGSGAAAVGAHTPDPWKPALTPRGRVIVAALPQLLGIPATNTGPPQHRVSRVGIFTAMAKVDHSTQRCARQNAVLTFFKRMAPARGQTSRVPAESENGRMAAESYFRYARPWGGQPSISYPSRTSRTGTAFKG